MNMKITLLSLLIMISVAAFAQDENKTINKSGFNFGFLPTISYDADMGFQYGALVNVFDYGKGNFYPDYKQQWKVEVSRYTGGSGVNQFFYDAKHVLPKNIRLTADLSYFTEQALDFYGFNGYQANYITDYVDKEADDYISRVFYKVDRKLFRFTLDFQGKLYGNHLRWLGGLAIMNYKMGAVDIDAINKKKSEDKQLPDTISLYDIYTENNLLSAEERDGGQVNFLKTGLVYDTRDQEANASKGIWSEAFLVYAPKVFTDRSQSFAKLVAIHRQYFTLVPNKLTFAYRLGYQGTIGGKAPYYFQPYMLTSFSTVTKTDGLGGAKNLRGIIRDRVVGDGIAYGNAELRWKFLKTKIGKQNIYVALNTFLDAGMVVQNIEVNKDLEQYSEYNLFNTTFTNDGLHPSAGAGLRIALNENFILAVDYGFAMNKNDGLKGLYINIGNLF